MIVSSPTGAGPEKDGGTVNESATLFLVKEDEEYCILFDQDDPVSLYEVLFEHAEQPDRDLSREEVFEVIEDLVPSRLRAM